MIHQENSRFIKSQKLKHNFHILHHKILNQILFWRKFNSLQLCLSKLKAKKCSIWEIWAKTLQVFLKVNKKAFFCQGKLHQDIFSKCKNGKHRDCRGHLEISKNSKIVFKRWKLSKLWLVQIGENARSQLWGKMHF